MFNTIIGIDISKKKTDWCVCSSGKSQELLKVGNTVDELQDAIQKLLESGIDKKEMLVCAEFTGKYIYPLAVACKQKGVFLWLENAYNINLYAKKQRGKSDSVDARRIADYAKKNQEDARGYVLPCKAVARLKQLLSLQRDFTTMRAKYKAKINDSKGFMDEDIYAEIVRSWEDVIDTYTSQLKKIDEEINSLINSDEELNRQNTLLLTVPGVGKKTAQQMIAYTGGFKSFPDGRKICCYIGVAPFGYESGTSVHTSYRVSDRANKQLKTTIHMAALSAATSTRDKKDNPFKKYYKRKAAEGKNKMQVLNAVRAKLVLTMFAVVRDNKPFDSKHEYKAK